jgi:hypothetical protein
VAGDWEEKDGSGRQQDSSQGWGRRQITQRPRRGRRALPAHTVELVQMCEAWPNSLAKIATTAGCLGEQGCPWGGAQ